LEKDKPRDLFIPKDISNRTIAAIIVDSEDIYVAVPMDSDPTSLAVTSQKAYPKTEIIIVYEDTYRIFLPRFNDKKFFFPSSLS
jgi:hypothetical protein